MAFYASKKVMLVAANYPPCSKKSLQALCTCNSYVFLFCNCNAEKIESIKSRFNIATKHEVAGTFTPHFESTLDSAPPLIVF